MTKFSDKICGDNENTHFMFRKFLPRTLRVLYNVEKYGRTRQATNDTVDGYCVLDI
jgi:hypothetical protein